ncbi:hypothetical protein AVEN_23976-1 [Araneus ventricosus]|uniref:Uncharacterized protein n=1 Tax=Araneus ventricosus TaxID=182803 RepID=A0A4Y2S661_ARAVE|nr:hypothetical protein AVEN_23976-1 [Araneus ventricosus]
MLKEEYEDWMSIDVDIPVAATPIDLKNFQAVCQQDQAINVDVSDGDEFSSLYLGRFKAYDPISFERSPVSSPHAKIKTPQLNHQTVLVYYHHHPHHY